MAPLQSMPEQVRLTVNAHGRQFLDVEHAAVCGRIALQGGQIIHCVPAGQQPLLWMSPADPCKPDTALRGGIPVCWPWFGDERDGPAHGIARTAHWQLRLAEADSTSVRLVLELPAEHITRRLPDEHWAVELELVLAASLRVTLSTTNTGSREQPLSQALHSYLPVDDIGNVRIHGLESVQYQDKLKDGAVFSQSGPIQVEREVDRVYFDTDADVQLSDGTGCPLLVQRGGSRSVVVWNPWIDKSRRLSQFPSAGYRGMVCIEAANAGPDALVLQPGQTHALTTTLSRPGPAQANPTSATDLACRSAGPQSSSSD